MKPHNAYCSFCRKSYRDVGPLVEGHRDVYICGECIELCQSIIDQEKRRRRPATEHPAEASKEVIRGRLDQLIAGHDEVKEALVLAALRRDSSGSSALRPVLLIGPTRSSRAFLARALSHAIEAPFADGDGQALVCSDTEPIEPLLYRLLLSTDFDVEAAQRGVAYVDGIEHRATQERLLQLCERAGSDSKGSRLQIDIGGLLFLCGGVFAGLEEVAARLGRHPEQPVTGETLAGLGVVPDLVSRLQAVVLVPPLAEEALVRILSYVDCGRVASAPQ